MISLILALAKIIVTVGVFEIKFNVRVHFTILPNFLVILVLSAITSLVLLTRLGRYWLPRIVILGIRLLQFTFSFKLLRNIVCVTACSAHKRLSSSLNKHFTLVSLRLFRQNGARIMIIAHDRVFIHILICCCALTMLTTQSVTIMVVVDVIVVVIVIRCR